MLEELEAEALLFERKKLSPDLDFRNYFESFSKQKMKPEQMALALQMDVDE